MKEIGIYEAVKLLKNYTENSVPVKLVHFTYDEKDGAKGVRIVNKAFYRKSFRKNQSKKHDVLINYTDEEIMGNKNRTFYLPLLISINGLKVAVK